MRVAIMQPTYLPWSGYFGLMRSVDLFIFLDSVQFAHRSWQQRNQIKTANGAQWLTVPVVSKGRRDQRIDHVEIDVTARFKAKHLATIEQNYRKAAYYQQASEILSPLRDSCEILADLNICLIKKISAQLGISTPMLRSSKLNGDGAKANFLASLCREVGATEYISPPGSWDYLNDSNAFSQVGIPISYFNYEHPEYPQLFGSFLPYMSIIDMMFNCGQASLSFIEAGCRIAGND